MSQSIDTASGAKPENNLVLAILSTVCCCVPTGIAAIIFAAQVDRRWAEGDPVGAADASENAKLWSYVSIGLGLLAGLGYAALIMTGHVEA